MFAISFDLDIAETARNHPRGSRQAYKDIEKILGRFGFTRVQWSVYVADHEDLGRLYRALDALRTNEWLRRSLTDLRAFRMEQGADLTSLVKGE